MTTSIGFDGRRRSVECSQGAMKSSMARITQSFTHQAAELFGRETSVDSTLAKLRNLANTVHLELNDATESHKEVIAGHLFRIIDRYNQNRSESYNELQNRLEAIDAQIAVESTPSAVRKELLQEKADLVEKKIEFQELVCQLAKLYDDCLTSQNNVSDNEVDSAALLLSNSLEQSEDIVSWCQIDPTTLPRHSKICHDLFAHLRAMERYIELAECFLKERIAKAQKAELQQVLSIWEPLVERLVQRFNLLKELGVIYYLNTPDAEQPLKYPATVSLSKQEMTPKPLVDLLAMMRTLLNTAESPISEADESEENLKSDTVIEAPPAAPVENTNEDEFLAFAAFIKEADAVLHSDGADPLAAKELQELIDALAAHQAWLSKRDAELRGHLRPLELSEEGMIASEPKLGQCKFYYNELQDLILECLQLQEQQQTTVAAVVEEPVVMPGVSSEIAKRAAAFLKPNVTSEKEEGEVKEEELYIGGRSKIVRSHLPSRKSKKGRINPNPSNAVQRNAPITEGSVAVVKGSISSIVQNIVYGPVAPVDNSVISSFGEDSLDTSEAIVPMLSGSLNVSQVAEGSDAIVTTGNSSASSTKGSSSSLVQNIVFGPAVSIDNSGIVSMEEDPRDTAMGVVPVLNGSVNVLPPDDNLDTTVTAGNLSVSSNKGYRRSIVQNVGRRPLESVNNDNLIGPSDPVAEVVPRPDRRILDLPKPIIDEIADDFPLLPAKITPSPSLREGISKFPIKTLRLTVERTTSKTASILRREKPSSSKRVLIQKWVSSRNFFVGTAFHTWNNSSYLEPRTVLAQKSLMVERLISIKKRADPLFHHNSLHLSRETAIRKQTRGLSTLRRISTESVQKISPHQFMIARKIQQSDGEIRSSESHSATSPTYKEVTHSFQQISVAPFSRQGYLPNQQDALSAATVAGLLLGVSFHHDLHFLPRANLLYVPAVVGFGYETRYKKSDAERGGDPVVSLDFAINRLKLSKPDNPPTVEKCQQFLHDLRQQIELAEGYRQPFVGSGFIIWSDLAAEVFKEWIDSVQNHLENRRKNLTMDKLANVFLSWSPAVYDMGKELYKLYKMGINKSGREPLAMEGLALTLHEIRREVDRLWRVENAQMRTENKHNTLVFQQKIVPTTRRQYQQLRESNLHLKLGTAAAPAA